MESAAARLAEVREKLEAHRREFEAYRDSTDRLIASLKGSLTAKELALAENETNLDAQQGRLNEKDLALSRSAADLKAIEASYRAQLNDMKCKLAAVESVHEDEMYYAEILRSRAAYGAREYWADLQKNLAAYKSQRAWTAMLLARKAYTLLFCRGGHGRIEFLKWVAQFPLSGTSGLAEFDLPFPDLSVYQPENLHTPLIRGQIPLKSIVRQGADEISQLPSLASRIKYDVLVLAIIDFEFRFQRPQQIATQFAREGHRVLWVSPSRFLSQGSEPYKLIELRENIWEIRLRGGPVDIYNGTLPADAIQSFSDSLDHLYRDLAVAEDCVIVQLPFWRGLALQLQRKYGSKIAYDCMDDWDTFKNLGSFNRSEEIDLAKHCDLLIVTSQQLVRKFEQRGMCPLLARNGAHFDFFKTAQPNDLLAGIPKPIVGYFGAIADWIDLDLIAEVARLRPSYSFVLIGEVFARDVSELKALPNVFLLGNKNYVEIPSYLFNFDACTIPFILNQVTDATDPVKLYEYFSLGKPVVATGMPELSYCGDLIYIGRDGVDFAKKLDVALTEANQTLAARRVAFAAASTWAKRVADIDAAISKTFPLVSILIVTYNSAEFISPCFESIRRNTAYPNYEVVVVDNNSTDGTMEVLTRHAELDARIAIITLDTNKGFATATNQAAAHARGEYFILQNADTMATWGWITRLMRPLCVDATIGLVCPVTNFAGNEVKITVDYRNDQEMEDFALKVAQENMGRCLDIAMAPLFCALIPRRVWDQIGELDASFQIGMFEDDDFSHRVRQAGFRIVAAEDCFVHHFGQGSFGKLDSSKYNEIFATNQRRFEEKWKSRWLPHRTRPGVKPAFEERPFVPATFFTPRV